MRPEGGRITTMGAAVELPSATGPRAAAAWLRTPRAASAGGAAVPSALSLALLLTPVLSATLLSKFAIPPFGAMGIAAGVLFNALACLAGLVSGQLRVAPARFAAFFMLIAAGGLVPLLRGEPLILTSLLFMVAVHLPYVLGPAQVRHDPQAVLRIYLDLALFCAVCGIAQFALQFVIGSQLAFPIENLLPAEILVDKYNKQGLLKYGSDIYRSNGVFLLEPSLFSQMLAVALIAELYLYNRRLRLAVMSMALLLSYSGTGLMVLMVCLPLVMIERRRWDLLLLGAAGALLLGAVGGALNLDIFASRVNEFGSNGTSAFARFVGGFYLFDEILLDTPMHALFGYGPGTFKLYAGQASVSVAEVAFTKMVFEFGIVGGLAYFAFIAGCVFRCDAPRIVRLAVFLTYFLGSAYVSFSHGLALSLLLWTTPLAPRAPRAAT